MIKSIFPIVWENFNNFPGQDLAISLLREQAHDLLDLASREDVAEVDVLLAAAVSRALGWLGAHGPEVVGGGGGGGGDGAGPDGGAEGERGEPGLRLTEGICGEGPAHLLAPSLARALVQLAV